MIVDGDPTVEIRDIRRIRQIFRGGPVADRRQLLELLRTNPGR